MKIKLLSIALTILILYSSVPLVIDAQSNHSLEWGVEVGEEFTYVMQRAYFADPSYITFISSYPFILSMTLGEKVTLRVDTLDEIPVQINESSQLPQSTCDLERANDSVSLYTNLHDFVRPIGDWEFIEEITNITGQLGTTLVDTNEEWGFIGSGSFLADDDVSVISYNLELKFEKENGTLNYLRLRYTTLGTDLVDVIIVNWHPGMPTIVSGGIQTPTILIIAIAGVVGVIVTIIVYQWYRSKKPIAQRLGE